MTSEKVNCPLPLMRKVQKKESIYPFNCWNKLDSFANKNYFFLTANVQSFKLLKYIIQNEAHPNKPFTIKCRAS